MRAFAGVLVMHSFYRQTKTNTGKLSKPMSMMIFVGKLEIKMAEVAHTGQPSSVQNRVLYWPQYWAELMLHSPIEANMCDELCERNLGHAAVRPGHVGLPGGFVGGPAVSSQPPSWWETWCGATGPVTCSQFLPCDSC